MKPTIFNPVSLQSFVFNSKYFTNVKKTNGELITLVTYEGRGFVLPNGISSASAFRQAYQLFLEKTK